MDLNNVAHIHRWASLLRQVTDTLLPLQMQIKLLLLHRYRRHTKVELVTLLLLQMVDNTALAM